MKLSCVEVEIHIQLQVSISMCHLPLTMPTVFASESESGTQIQPLCPIYSCSWHQGFCEVERTCSWNATVLALLAILSGNSSYRHSTSIPTSRPETRYTHKLPMVHKYLSFLLITRCGNLSWFSCLSTFGLRNPKSTSQCVPLPHWELQGMRSPSCLHRLRVYLFILLDLQSAQTALRPRMG